MNEIGMTAAEIIKRGDEEEKRLSKLVYLEDGFVILAVAYEYEIALSRCDTIEKILSWVTHLSSKKWMTIDVMSKFIRTACEYHGFNPYLMP